MNGIARKNRHAGFPRAKIQSLVQTALPKGEQFNLYVENSKIGNLKIVRIVTPAWKNLRPSARITKVIRMANKELTATEQKKILRFSVLTPEEFSQIHPG
jgi:hypothetical protein